MAPQALHLVPPAQGGSNLKVRMDGRRRESRRRRRRFLRVVEEREKERRKK